MRYVSFLILLVVVLAACGDTTAAADPARFCEILAELDSQDTTGMAADEALPIIQEGRDKYQEGIEVAPEEIKADAETFANYVIEITDLLIAAEGDQSQVDVTAIEEIPDDGVGDAAERVGAWRADNCT